VLMEEDLNGLFEDRRKSRRVHTDRSEKVPSALLTRSRAQVRGLLWDDFAVAHN